MKRLVITTLRAEAGKVEALLKEVELVYEGEKVVVGEEKCVRFGVFVPDHLVDSLINKASKVIDLRLKENMITLYSVEAAISTYLDRLELREITEPSSPNPIEKLVMSTDKYTRPVPYLLAMASLASIVALTGLLLDNVVIIIGAMLLSPLLGPINASAVNANLGRVKKLTTSLLFTFLLLGAILAPAMLATLVASLFIQLPITPQVVLRGQVTFVDVGLSIILGVAGGVSLVTALPEMLVGVAVAVALVPPATVAGIGLAVGDIALFNGAFLLTATNLVGLSLGSTLTLRFMGVSPRRYYQKKLAKKYTAYSSLILTILLVLLILIITITV